MIPVLLVVTAFFRPAAPTVGDPITIQVWSGRLQPAGGGQKPAAPLATLDRSPQFEILSQRGNTFVIRTFDPRPFAISGRVGNVAFRNMIVPIRSVLKPNDNMTPSPLKPPRRERYPRLPFVAIAVAALAAIAAWTAVVLQSRQKIQPAVPALPPAEHFRAIVIALRDDPRAARRWARLADALREYLAATSDLSADLTTTEVIARSSSNSIAEILRQGDLEKFSPWGAAHADFESIANRALELAPEPALEEVAA